MTPERTCIVCRTKKPKNHLIRIVLSKNGEINVEKTPKLDGRGAYICNGTECVEKLIKTRALNRTFKKNFSEQEYNNLIDKIKA